MTSSQIHSIGHDPETQTLRIQFKDRTNKKGETIAYRTKSFHGDDAFGVAISHVQPGYYAFIKIAGADVTVVRTADGSLIGQ